MNTEILWQEIMVTALLGTQRKPFQAPPAGGKLAAAIQASSASHANADEIGLLCAAALTALHRRAGRLPVTGIPADPSPCPAEEWPRCSPLAGNFLEQILTGGKIDLLIEWIHLAAQSQQRIREEHLPLVLEQQRVIQNLRRTLLPVLGKRGQWLAARNPNWSACAVYNDERVWTDGTRQERQIFLGDLRVQDAARARELLAAAWAEEPPAERIGFLKIFQEQLGLEDEPFLEKVLDDRRKDVRQAATGLLAQLPEARLTKRMTERACRLLRWKPGLLRSTLEVSLPETCDEAMLRDGIETRPPAGSTLGEKAWWLTQIIAFVPPRTWTMAWNKRPAQILDAIRKHEWEAALLEGWREAALRSQDSEWLDALINHDYKSGENRRMLDLFPRLPAAYKEKLVLSLLSDHPSLSYDTTPSICLSACRNPWGIDLTQAVITEIGLTLQKKDFQAWRWEKLLRDIAPFFHPDLLERAIERISAALKKKESGDPAVRSLLAALEFRLEMRRAFLVK